MNKFYLVTTLIFNYLIAFSQTSEDFKNIKTIILKPVNATSFAPIVQLNEPLILSFDDLNATNENFIYKIDYYTYDWQQANLSETEFINGYASYRIRDYENSYNTLQPYTHYSVTFPNEYTRFKITGNYVISVIDEKGQVVFRRKFVLYQPKVTVGVTVYKSRDLEFIATKQAVEFNVNYSNLIINNPNEEIFPVILQNNNWQNAIFGLKPQFYRNAQLIYKYNKETSFWAGNEFLYFDSKSIRNSTLHIAKVELGENLYETYLYTDEEQRFQPYTLNPDINGNFIVRILDGENSDTEADYSRVHFSLKTTAELTNKAIYVSGNFNDWQLNDENKMHYNADKNLYEATILLKQGFYNYQYVTLSNNGTISNYDIDGSFYETENDYKVLVYYNKFGNRYSEVIGLGTANSTKINN